MLHSATIWPAPNKVLLRISEPIVAYTLSPLREEWHEASIAVDAVAVVNLLRATGQHLMTCRRQQQQQQHKQQQWRQQRSI